MISVEIFSNAAPECPLEPSVDEFLCARVFSIDSCYSFVYNIEYVGFHIWPMISLLDVQIHLYNTFMSTRCGVMVFAKDSPTGGVMIWLVQIEIFIS